MLINHEFAGSQRVKIDERWKMLVKHEGKRQVSEEKRG